MACAKVKAAVSGYEAEFGGRVRVRTLECDSPEGKAAAQRYGFLSHGIVIFDPHGQVAFMRRDHLVNAAEVHHFLTAAVAKLPLR